MARFEYRTVNTDTLKGLEEAARLYAAGWRIVRNGTCVQFCRKLPSPSSGFERQPGLVEAFDATMCAWMLLLVVAFILTIVVSFPVPK